MRQRFLEEIAQALAARRIATYRYEFAAINARTAEPRVRQAVEAAAHAAPGLPLFAGGKSFGGRMTSQAQAAAPLPGVRGLVFLGFPLHPPGRPGTERAEHLAAVRVPMLFLQGTRDAFAKLDLLRPVVAQLGKGATLLVMEGGDHSFKGSSMGALVDAMTEWMESHA